MKTENQIIRIPLKYSELFETMEDCECWKLCKALFKKNPENLDGLSLTYYNIIIVDIDNIEKQVNIWKKYWKLWAEYWKKWWRPKKENPGGGYLENPQDKISKDKISKDNNIENFNNFYKLYPKKIWKAQAIKTYEKLMKKHSCQFILEQLQKQLSYWKKEKQDIKYIPYPSTWLNNHLLDFEDIQVKPKLEIKNTDIVIDKII